MCLQSQLSRVKVLTTALHAGYELTNTLNLMTIASMNHDHEHRLFTDFYSIIKLLSPAHCISPQIQMIWTRETNFFAIHWVVEKETLSSFQGLLLNLHKGTLRVSFRRTSVCTFTARASLPAQLNSERVSQSSFISTFQYITNYSPRLQRVSLVYLSLPLQPRTS